MALFRVEEVAFVIGAALGIGRATALQFVTDGICQISLIDVSEDALKETAALISTKNAKSKTIVITGDVPIAKDVDKAIAETVSAFGRIDYYVNSARTGGLFGPIAEQEEETLDKTLRINVNGI